MSIPVPSGPDRESTEQSLRAEKAYQQAIRDQYYEVFRYPPLPEGAQQVWALPAGATEWEHLGVTTGPIVGVDFGAPDPGETAVIAWPYQHGKTAALTTVEASLTGSMRALYDALLAGYQADLDQRLHRLADDLVWWGPRVRRDWHAVQQVLEEAGIGDGYGRLTIPPPVRPPVEPPPRRP